MKKQYLQYLAAFITVFGLVNYTRDYALSTRASSQSTLNSVCDGVNLDNIDADPSRASDIYSKVRAAHTDKTIDQLILKNITSEEYAKSLVPYFVPPLVISIVTFVLMVGCIVQCTMRSCCDVGCCKHDIVEDPYSKISIFGCSAIAFFSLVGIFGVSIAGIVYSTNYDTKADQSECALYSVQYNLLYGKPDSRWLGIDGLSSELNQLLSNLTSYQKQFETYTQAEVQTTSIPKAINDTYTAINGRTVANPIYGASPAQITPSLVEMIGPYSNSTSVTGSLYTEYNNLTVPVNNYLQQFATAVNEIGKHFPQVTKQLQNGVQYVNQFQASLQTADEKSGNNTDKIQHANNQIKIGSIITFSVLLFFSLVGVLTIILMLSVKINILRYMIYTTWIFVGFFTFIGFLVSSLMVVVTIVTTESCWVLNQTLTNQSQYQLYSSQFFDETYYNDTQLCLFGNGDLAQHFGFNYVVDNLNDMAETIDELSQIAPQILNLPNLAGKWINVSNFQQQNPASVSNLTFLEQTYNIPPSSTQAPQATYQTNQWSDYNAPDQKQQSVGACKVLQDQVSFNYENCGQGRTQVAQTNPTEKIGFQTCVKVYTPDFINTRLKAVDFSSCQTSANVKSQYQNNYDQLITYWTELKVVLKDLNLNLQNVQTQNQYVYQQYNNTYTQILQFSAPINGTLIAIGNNQTGLANNLNCTFLRTDMSNVNKSFCQSYLIDIFALTVVLILICSFGFCGMIGLYFSTTRLSFWSAAIHAEIEARKTDDPSGNTSVNLNSTNREFELTQGS